MDAIENYQRLAQRLDELPQGFPAAEDGVELRLLAYLFTPEEAALAARMRLTLETPAEIADRLGMDFREVSALLKSMAKKRLINVGGIPRGGMGFGLLPFVVGFYELQVGRMDQTFAELFEAYYQQTRAAVIQMQPPLHRVIPVGEAIAINTEVQPYQSAAALVRSMASWGVSDCICRKQRALLGEGCEHPLEVCMVLSERENAFQRSDTIRNLTLEEALAVLQQAADAGLVHSVSNHREDTWYICNCCTCSCAILRGMQEMGLADVVAKAPFVAQLDVEVCIACDACAARCSFHAIQVQDDSYQVIEATCQGCGQCVLVCPADAIQLVDRHTETQAAVYETEEAWLRARAAARQIDLDRVL